MTTTRKTMPPIHPGDTLREDFMKPLGLTANRLAINLRVPAARIGEIVNGRRAITADTAPYLARYFEMSPQFWTNLQANYELEVAQEASATRSRRTALPKWPTCQNSPEARYSPP